MTHENKDLRESTTCGCHETYPQLRQPAISHHPTCPNRAPASKEGAGPTVEPYTDEELAQIRTMVSPTDAKVLPAVRRLLATIAARDAERDRVIKALDEMRAINAMLTHWYDEAEELLHKSGVDPDGDGPLSDLAENMRSYLGVNHGYDFKKVRIYKAMERQAAALLAHVSGLGYGDVPTCLVCQSQGDDACPMFRKDWTKP